MSSSKNNKMKGSAISSPSRENRSSKFTADGVKEYEKRRYRGLDQRIVHAREVRILKKIFKSVKGRWSGPARVLDMPCGYGRFSGFLLGQGFWVVNCDLSFHMVKRACEKVENIAESGKGSPGAVGNATLGLPFQDKAFPVVFSIRFFHHVHDPSDRGKILGEFFRVSSAWAVVSFYQMNVLHLFQRRLRRLLKKSRTHIKMIEPGLFEKEAEAAGFVVRRVYPLIRGLHAYHIALLEKS